MPHLSKHIVWGAIQARSHCGHIWDQYPYCHSDFPHQQALGNSAKPLAILTIEDHSLWRWPTQWRLSHESVLPRYFLICAFFCPTVGVKTSSVGTGPTRLCSFPINSGPCFLSVKQKTYHLHPAGAQRISCRQHILVPT